MCVVCARARLCVAATLARGRRVVNVAHSSVNDACGAHVTVLVAAAALAFCTLRPNTQARTSQARTSPIANLLHTSRGGGGITRTAASRARRHHAHGGITRTSRASSS
ncbi:hypothetical protein WOLCODRAFT_29779 [Wolfiporia cocos MD-104 SS10]|uniref:Uncharacterized protein n=1 Tax=Wolfiporia cocos (strain MD-104) TaxID=742152 RepID=A0A2H3JHV0_WOLCO|nr:hypothetical protein WOLCODRAFT_29779 [Wolfiporia cocos MD-104 SS10]